MTFLHEKETHIEIRRFNIGIDEGKQASKQKLNPEGIEIFVACTG